MTKADETVLILAKKIAKKIKSYITLNFKDQNYGIIPYQPIVDLLSEHIQELINQSNSTPLKFRLMETTPPHQKPNGTVQLSDERFETLNQMLDSSLQTNEAMAKRLLELQRNYNEAREEVTALNQCPMESEAKIAERESAIWQECLDACDYELNSATRSGTKEVVAAIRCIQASIKARRYNHTKRKWSK